MVLSAGNYDDSDAGFDEKRKVMHVSGKEGRLDYVVIDPDYDSGTPEFFYIPDNIADPFGLYHEGMLKGGRLDSQE